VRKTFSTAMFEVQRDWTMRVFPPAVGNLSSKQTLVPEGSKSLILQVVYGSCTN